MEGRTIARPNDLVPGLAVNVEVASMEGRTIARPNVTETVSDQPCGHTLQWRAGQLPGQTGEDEIAYVAMY